MQPAILHENFQNGPLRLPSAVNFDRSFSITNVWVRHGDDRQIAST